MRRANPHRADALPSPRARQLNFMVISTLEKRVAELEAQVLQNSKAAVKDAREGRVKSLEEHVHKVARKSVDEQVSRIDEKLGEKNKEQQSMLMEKMQTIASKAAEKGVKGGILHQMWGDAEKGKGAKGESVDSGKGWGQSSYMAEARGLFRRHHACVRVGGCVREGRGGKGGGCVWRRKKVGLVRGSEAARSSSSSSLQLLQQQ